MKREDAEEYTQALGQVVAGGWRQVAWGVRQGVPQALGITTEQWVEGRLGGYARMHVPERREAVAELTEEGMSRPEIGSVLGIHPNTVTRDRQASPNGASTTPPVEEVASAPSPNGENDGPAPNSAERVNGAAPDVDEAAQIDAQRDKRIAAWVRKIDTALTVLTRMAGFPVPAELAMKLDDDQRKALELVLKALAELGDNE